MTPVRVGLIGCGKVGSLHTAAVRSLPEAELAALEVVGELGGLRFLVRHRRGHRGVDALWEILGGDDRSSFVVFVRRQGQDV